jgi:hypothetical protein
MDFVTVLLQQPAVVGAAITAGMNMLHGALVGLDKQNIADKFGPQLHVAFLILSFLASVANAAASGTLSNIDLSSVGTFLQYWVTVLVGGKAMAVVPSNKVDWRKMITGK